MKNSSKSVVMVILLVVAMILPTIILAEGNPNMVVNKGSDYLIYNKEAIKTNEAFTFAFSKDGSETGLVYFPSTTDTDSTPNQVAYVDSTTQAEYNNNLDSNNETYLVIRKNGAIVDKQKLSLDNAIVEDITERIPATPDSDTTTTTKDGVTTETTRGKLVVDNTDGVKHSYVIMSAASGDYKKLMEYAETLADSSKLSSMTLVEKIELLDNFTSLYNEKVPAETDSAWIDAGNGAKIEIPQPSDAKDGDKYIVFIKKDGANGIIRDAQFMTSVVKEDQKYEKGTVTIKETSSLPVTYDSTITLIAILAVIVVAIIVVLFVRKKADKKENK